MTMAKNCINIMKTKGSEREIKIPQYDCRCLVCGTTSEKCGICLHEHDDLIIVERQKPVPAQAQPQSDAAGRVWNPVAKKWEFATARAIEQMNEPAEGDVMEQPPIKKNKGGRPRKVKMEEDLMATLEDMRKDKIGKPHLFEIVEHIPTGGFRGRLAEAPEVVQGLYRLKKGQIAKLNISAYKNATSAYISMREIFKKYKLRGRTCVRNKQLYFTRH